MLEKREKTITIRNYKRNILMKLLMILSPKLNSEFFHANIKNNYYKFQEKLGLSPNEARQLDKKEEVLNALNTFF